MKTAIHVDISFDQVLGLVPQLSTTEKIILLRQLEKEAIETKLTNLLEAFNINELSLETINEEVEIVRQNRYESEHH